MSSQYPGFRLLGARLGIPSCAGTTLQVLGGSKYITKLQQALKRLAKATGNSKLDPKSEAGNFDCDTALAMSAAIPYLKKVPKAADIPGPLWFIMENIGRVICLNEGRVVLGGQSFGRGFGQTESDDDSAAIEENAPEITEAVDEAVEAAEAEAEADKVPPSAGRRPSLSIKDLLKKTPTAETVVQVFRYPEGSITTRVGKLWRVGIPLTAVIKPSGLKGPNGLDGPVTHQEVSPVSTRPLIAEKKPVPEVPKNVFEDKTGTKPIWKKWWFWAIAGGAVLASGTGYYYMRRRKAQPAAQPKLGRW